MRTVIVEIPSARSLHATVFPRARSTALWRMASVVPVPIVPMVVMMSIIAPGVMIVPVIAIVVVVMPMVVVIAIPPIETEREKRRPIRPRIIPVVGPRIVE